MGRDLAFGLLFAVAFVILGCLVSIAQGGVR